jgi:hypothetical protein
MYFFKFTFTSSLYVLTFVLLLHKPVFGADPIFQICEKSGNLTNFTTNDPYETNLKKLMGDLSYKTPPSGFSFSSVGVKHMGLLFVVVMSRILIVVPVLLRQVAKFASTAPIIKVQLHGMKIVK